MKEKNKYLLAIFVIIACQVLYFHNGLAVVNAEQDSDIIKKSTSSTIQAAEYFIDFDPGKGNGIPLTAADGTFDGLTERISLNLNTSNLAKGSHYIFLRFKSSEGVWGNTRGFLINIGTTNLERHIISAEYFFDTDPGFGKGTKLTCEDGQFDEKIEDLKKIGIETSNLSIGQHKVYVRAQASDGAWGEAVSKSITVIAPDIPPAIPKNLSAEPGDKKATLNWSPNSEADLSFYKIYRSQIHGFNPTVNDSLAVVIKPNTSYIDYAVNNEIKYYYRISAVDNAGNESGFSVEVSATPRENIAPAIPQNLQANSSDKKVTLAWSANTESDLSCYKIYRSLTHGFSPTVNDLLATVYKPNISYADNNVTNGVTYYYRISAVDNSGNESGFSNEVSATPKANKPTMPKNFQAIAGDKKVTLSWSQNPESDLSHYQIYRSQLHGFVPAITDTLTMVLYPDNSYIDTEVINGLTYYYRISAVNVAGDESDFSAEASATPQAGITIPNIGVSALEHNFGDVPLLATVSWQVIIDNQGTANLEVKDIVSDNPVFSANTRQFIIEPGSGHSVYIQFTPDSLQAERGTVTIFSNDPDQPEIKITLSGKGIDNQAPEIILPTPTAKMWISADYLLSAQIKDNWAIESALLLYRKGSDGNFQSLALSQGQGDNYFVTIPSSALTFSGLAYFIKAEDSSGNRTFSDTLSQAIYFQDGVLTTSRISSPYQAGYPRGEWHQISAPAVLDQASLTAVLNDETELGNYGEPNWRLFSYQDTDGDNITDGYVEYRSELAASVFRFDSGKAFWLKANPSGAKIEIDIGAGHILPLDPQTIPLKPGWNQIGDPFAFPIAFAPNDSRIVNKLYLPDGSGGYQLATTMQPWAGYFLFVNGNAAVDLKLAPKPGNPLNKTIADEAEWMFQIDASCGTSTDEINYLGISETSTDEWDSNDYPEPPAIGEYISLYFPHEDWQEHCKNFTSDFRNNVGKGQIWNLIVTTNQKSSEVNLSWSQLIAADENLQFQLYDCNRNKTIDMEKANDYRFSRLNQEINSPFQILVGSREFIDRQVAEIQSRLPNEFCLFQNYPNPFNSITQIRFQLPLAEKVSLKILNVMGREVRALLNEHRAAGSYEISWDGKDNQGNNAGTGVYLCVFQAGRYFESRKVLLLK